jgi:hypothetical protein
MGGASEVDTHRVQKGQTTLDTQVRAFPLLYDGCNTMGTAYHLVTKQITAKNYGEDMNG